MKWSIILLIGLLLGTNGFWLCSSIDQGITGTYRDQHVNDLERTQEQLIEAIPRLTSQLSKQQIITILTQYSNNEPYEKEGCTWVGMLGLKFSDDGVLEAVTPSWSFDNKNTCLQP